MTSLRHALLVADAVLAITPTAPISPRLKPFTHHKEIRLPLLLFWFRTHVHVKQQLTILKYWTQIYAGLLHLLYKLFVNIM
ncbi:hypothetical protein BCL69_10918 [Nitrosomonas communis]|uniref:Uncharacterized protein n=1 Tax=Nitrosomonas communis TaxID=44574 RepID=A0A0F7KCB9_9PROT|nr:hypothetical protein AAW31_04510 [Nitrosomonas communis]TYP73717.1 hypothetical protein BCL69_10918 [Nitrosomonas communis]